MLLAVRSWAQSVARHDRQHNTYTVQCRCTGFPPPFMDACITHTMMGGFPPSSEDERSRPFPHPPPLPPARYSMNIVVHTESDLERGPSYLPLASIHHLCSLPPLVEYRHPPPLNLDKLLLLLPILSRRRLTQADRTPGSRFLWFRSLAIDLSEPQSLCRWLTGVGFRFCFVYVLVLWREPHSHRSKQ